MLTGPPPKHPSQRRRRNVAAGTVELPADPGWHGVVPELPDELKPARGWPMFVKDWWCDIWSSPMAHVWTKSDYYGLVRGAQLLEVLVREGISAALDEEKELRALEDRFGLSPMARRRLQWELGQRTLAVVEQLPLEGMGPVPPTPTPARSRSGSSETAAARRKRVDMRLAGRAGAG